VVRYALAAIVLMPVPSVCVQYAITHDFDAKLAGALTNYSQVASLIALCALGFLSGGGGGAAAARWVMPAGLVAAAAVVAALGFVADKALAPKKMIFKPKEAAVSKLAIAKPPGGSDEAGGAGKGPTVASALGGSAGGYTGGYTRGKRSAAAGRSAGGGAGDARRARGCVAPAPPRGMFRATAAAAAGTAAAGGARRSRVTAASAAAAGRSSAAAATSRRGVIRKSSLAARPAAAVLA
jgi:hypothetical protein